MNKHQQLPPADPERERLDLLREHKDAIPNAAALAVQAVLEIREAPRPGPKVTISTEGSGRAD